MPDEVLFTVVRKSLGGNRVLAINWSDEMAAALDATNDEGELTDDILDRIRDVLETANNMANIA